MTEARIRWTLLLFVVLGSWLHYFIFILMISKFIAQVFVYFLTSIQSAWVELAKAWEALP